MANNNGNGHKPRGRPPGSWGPLRNCNTHKFPDKLQRAVERMARAHGISEPELVRRKLTECFQEQLSPRIVDVWIERPPEPLQAPPELPFTRDAYFALSFDCPFCENWECLLADPAVLLTLTLPIDTFVKCGRCARAFVMRMNWTTSRKEHAYER